MIECGLTAFEKMQAIAEFLADCLLVHDAETASNAVDSIKEIVAEVADKTTG